MANSEDYLDGLLNSVQNVRKDVTDAQKQTEEILREKQEQRNKIKPQDDFMEASGIRDYKPEPSTHENLRKALSEDEFLKKFEEELDEDIDESDSFIREFEDEIAQDELSYEQDEQPASFMDNIENIVNQAKEQLEHEEQAEDTDEIPILHIEEDTAEDTAEDDESVNEEAEQIRLDEEAEPEEDSSDVDDDLPALDGYGADEMDEQFAKDQGEASIGEAGEDLLAKYLEMNGSEQDEESSLIDEDDDNIDLMGLLSGDDDLNDIGSLLQADGEDAPLEEAQETFDEMAEKTDTSSEEALQNVKNQAAGKEADKAGEKGLKALLAKIKAIFQKKESDAEVLDLSQAPQEDLGQENLEILKELSAAEAKSKKEKKEKKPKKEKKQKAPKEKKPKVKKERPQRMPKEPDNSPKIPTKLIVVFLILAMSIVVFVTITQHMTGYKLSMTEARTEYNAGDYFAAYEDLMGMDLKESDEDLFKKSRLLGDLQKKNKEYQVFVKRKMYDLALDSLVSGVARYQDNLDEAKTLGIEEEYTKEGDALVQLLQDQYGVSVDDAVSMYRLNREQYSIKIDEIVETLNLN